MSLLQAAFSSHGSPAKYASRSAQELLALCILMVALRANPMIARLAVGAVATLLVLDVVRVKVRAPLKRNANPMSLLIARVGNRHGF
jgi:hypothetical protein